MLLPALSLGSAATGAIARIVTATADRPHPLAAYYDDMWTEAAPVVRAGGGVLDPWVSRRAEDARRGITLLARPAPRVTDTLADFLEHLREIEPAQYYQPRRDLHHTVLSLFSAVPDYARYLARVPAYQAAVAEVAAETPPFAIDVRGVTLSTGAVLAQGFPRGDALAELRDRMSAALVARGLGDTLDGRYRIVTAHLTLVRFAAPLRRPERFVEALAAARTMDFGTSAVERLDLVLGDWYHTEANEQPLGEYALGTASLPRGAFPE
jgi:2'-5' RNA ligase